MPNYSRRRRQRCRATKEEIKGLRIGIWCRQKGTELGPDRIITAGPPLKVIVITARFTERWKGSERRRRTRRISGQNQCQRFAERGKWKGWRSEEWNWRKRWKIDIKRKGRNWGEDLLIQWILKTYVIRAYTFRKKLHLPTWMFKIGLPFNWKYK